MTDFKIQNGQHQFIISTRVVAEMKWPADSISHTTRFWFEINIPQCFVDQIVDR